LVTIQDTELKEGILKAIDSAKIHSTSILVSEVQKINHKMDPLSFFATGNKNYTGERFFWKDPSNQLFIIGIGICKQIESDQAADRFFHVEKEWDTFLENAIIFDKHHTKATGPTAFGGFSFDPLKLKSVLWEKFSDSLFHVPKFMLTLIKGQAYLTTNVVVSANEHMSLFDNIEKERQQLLKEVHLHKVGQFVQLETKEEKNTENWKKTVTKVAEELKTNKGNALKKVVLARELRLLFDGYVQSELVLKNLLNEQNESFVFALESKGDCFTGASPERLVKKSGEDVYSTCLAGSIKRGRNEAEDECLGKELLTDHKNLMEHSYVVEMIKEAMEDTCFGVELPDQPQLLKMKHIQHLYTPVIGKTNAETPILRFVEKLHPTPALGGLPKQLAVEKIREVEELDRGFYGGPLGWLDYKGNGEFAVSIRSGLLQGKEASIFAGCGVVEDSNADLEFEETSIKFKPMLSALGGLT
jgi:menaquinone-specific isochorismate synthase